ncbi:MAG: lysophospholipase [Acidimicrobiales bacterium]
MQTDTMTIEATDGARIHTARWLPDEGTPVRAVLQIAHGMAEHSQRYERFARALTGAGYAVYANDHRGHGQTAEFSGNRGYFADGAGFDRVVKDMAEVTARARAEQPGKPVVLFGHSMGSFLSRAYVLRYGDDLAGLILSGTGGSGRRLSKLALWLARAEARIRGRQAPSTMLSKMTFGSFNREFKPNRTDFDWLSRDDAEVDAYAEDPWCGEVFTTGFFVDLFRASGPINDDDVVASVPKDLPILLISGDMDPVGGELGEGVIEVAEQYKRLGVTDVTAELYPGARHELLNETNRDEVTNDVLTWLNNHLPKD